MKFVNLTPHTLNVHVDEGAEVRVIEPSGTVARVDVTYTETSRVGGINVSTATYGDVNGLPEPEKGVAYIVSAVKRNDVFAPGHHVRDVSGKPCGCEGLKQTV